MNYLKQYIKLIRKRQKFLVEEGENHHIFPTCLFGKNKLTVKLSIREHFIAHKLLYKICEKRYGYKHNNTIKMLFALKHMMKDNRNNEKRKETVLILSSKLFELVRSSHPTMLPETREKISKSKKGRKIPQNCGENNPACKPGVGEKISKSKLGVPRPDMQGKKYFGATEESISAGIEKMRQKKTGMKIDYPKNRNSPPCSPEKAQKIKESKKLVDKKFIEMTEIDFENWISDKKLYRSDGNPNSNITRILKLRGITKERYYN